MNSLDEKLEAHLLQFAKRYIESANMWRGDGTPMSKLLLEESAQALKPLIGELVEEIIGEDEQLPAKNSTDNFGRATWGAGQFPSGVRLNNQLRATQREKLRDLLK